MRGTAAKSFGQYRRANISWTPKILFSASEVGAWYDPSDPTTVWQNSARTVPALVDDLIGAIDDKSGNGHHALQFVTAKRPILRTSGGLWYLDFDGINDGISSNFGVTLAQPNHIFVSTRFTGVTGRFLYTGVASGVSNSLFSNSDLWTLSAGSQKNTAAAVTAADVVLSTLFTTNSVLRVNGVSIAPVSAGTDSLTGVTIGESFSATLPGEFRLYGLVVNNRELTGSDLAGLEDYLAKKAGVTL